MADALRAGIVEVRSRYPVGETVERLRKTLEERGATLFALVDHSGEAAKVGIEMPETKLLIFGNPKAGTPVMLASPTSALDLPLKLLVREDGGGVGGSGQWSGCNGTNGCLVGYNSPAWVAERHGVAGDLVKVLAAVEGLAASVAGPVEGA